MLNSVGSQQKSGLGNITATALMEEARGDLPFPNAFIRAGSFLENNVSSLGPAAAMGIFYSFLQPVEPIFPMVGTADIGSTKVTWGYRMPELNDGLTCRLSGWMV